MRDASRSTQGQLQSSPGRDLPPHTPKNRSHTLHSPSALLAQGTNRLIEAILAEQSPRYEDIHARALAERGNLVFAGHNDIYGEVFRDLADLQPGDEVTVYTASQRYRYVIQGWRIVKPSDVSALESTVNPSITLISCYPYLVDTDRIVVFGKLAGG